MWMNGSRRARSTPANARRTGNPSPSKPDGAVVTDSTGRSAAAVASGSWMRGSTRMSSTVTAGISSPPLGRRCAHLTVASRPTTVVDSSTFPAAGGPGYPVSADGIIGPGIGVTHYYLVSGSWRPLQHETEAGAGEARDQHGQAACRPRVRLLSRR